MRTGAVLRYLGAAAAMMVRADPAASSSAWCLGRIPHAPVRTPG